MVQVPDKWQKRQAEALAAEEGLSVAEATARVMGTTRPRKVAEVKTPAEVKA